MKERIFAAIIAFLVVIGLVLVVKGKTKSRYRLTHELKDLQERVEQIEQRLGIQQ
tara:strand:+ start:579 stop:743 length:165 start_codon:yes stop_codon:yes gene_type:complete